jgi:hypothetical protein
LLFTSSAMRAWTSDMAEFPLRNPRLGAGRIMI